jgi:hypothetical protein
MELTGHSPSTEPRRLNTTLYGSKPFGLRTTSQVKNAIAGCLTLSAAIVLRKIAQGQRRTLEMNATRGGCASTARMRCTCRWLAGADYKNYRTGAAGYLVAPARAMASAKLG